MKVSDLAKSAGFVNDDCSVVVIAANQERVSTKHAWGVSNREDTCVAALAIFPEHPLVQVADYSGVRKFKDLEKDILQSAIDHCNGHVVKACKQLGIGRSSMYRKIKLYGLDAKRSKK